MKFGYFFVYDEVSCLKFLVDIFLCFREFWVSLYERKYILLGICIGKVLLVVKFCLV